MRILLRILLFVVVVLLRIGGGAAYAQDVGRLPVDVPGERPFEPEIGTLPEGGDHTILPRILKPSATDRLPDLSATAILVKTIAFSGNEAIGDDVLEKVALPFLDRRLGPAELQAMMVEMSRVYLDAGYVNSGVTLPNQRVVGHHLEIKVIEGRLGEVEVSGLRFFKPAVLERRLRHAIGSPLRLREVEEALRLLERETTIRRLDARLRPTEERGVARLVVSVEEKSPYWTDFGIDNHAPRSVGTLASRFSTGYDNLLGFGDRFSSRATFTEGLWRLALAYDLPVHPAGTLLGVEMRLSRAKVVQRPFDLIDVESRAQSFGGSIRHPIIRDLDRELVIGLIAEHRRSRSTLLGRSFMFPSDRGRVRLTLLRPFLEWTSRREQVAYALRSVFSLGLNAPGTTKSEGNSPDGRFFSWLGQARGVYRHPATQIEFHMRLDVQLSDRPLLSLERTSIGGPGSVRGYPRNLLVRDQSFAGSLEIRCPIWIGSKGNRIVTLAPFVDVGRAWNRDRATPGIRTLSSAGMALRISPIPPLSIDVEWALPIRDVDGDGSLQARGVLLSARWKFR